MRFESKFDGKGRNFVTTEIGEGGKSILFGENGRIVDANNVGTAEFVGGGLG